MGLKKKQSISASRAQVSIAGVPDELAPKLPAEVEKRFPSLKLWREEVEQNWQNTRRALSDILEQLRGSIDSVPISSDLSKTWVLENPAAGLTATLLQAQGSLSISRIVTKIDSGSIRFRMLVTDLNGNTRKVIDPWSDVSSDSVSTISAMDNPAMAEGELLSAEILSVTGTITTGSVIVFYRETD